MITTTITIPVITGRRYKTRGGWTAHIATCINGNPQGWCKDQFGNEEPSMGTWDENTGKCLKRGDSSDKQNTEPFDLIEDYKKD